MSDQTQSKKVLLATDDEHTLRLWLLDLEKYGFEIDDADDLIKHANIGLASVSSGEHQLHFTSSAAIAEQAIGDRQYSAIFVDGLVGGHSTHKAINDFLDQSKTARAYMIKNSSAILTNFINSKIDVYPLIQSGRLVGGDSNFDTNEAYLAKIFDFEVIKSERRASTARTGQKRAYRAFG